MAESIKSYEDLEVWQGGIELCVQIYEVVERLPASERFELSSQMRRSAVSVPRTSRRAMRDASLNRSSITSTSPSGHSRIGDVSGHCVATQVHHRRTVSYAIKADRAPRRDAARSRSFAGTAARADEARACVWRVCRVPCARRDSRPLFSLIRLSLSLCRCLPPAAPVL